MIRQHTFLNRLLVLGCGCLLLAGIFQMVPDVSYAGAKKVNLRIASWNPIKLPPPLDYEPYTYAHDQWCDMIEKASNGQIKFTRFWGGTLLQLPQLLDGVKSRMADLAGVHTPVYPGAFPMTEALQLPGLFPNARKTGKGCGWELWGNPKRA
jgi:TRAP-type C4-dicarboxylate transport system substrate-binding protein